MKIFLQIAALALSMLCVSTPAHAQTATNIPSTDSLIEHSLSYVDYPAFVRHDALPPMKPRLGIYMNNFPADSVRLLTHGTDTIKGNRIWHVAPHWSADNAGLMIGDVVLRVNGRTLADSVYGPDDILNIRISLMHAGDTLQFQILRKGIMRNVTVPLQAAKRLPPMAYTEPAGLGALRKNSWMQRTVAEKGLTGWADSIAMQLAAIADMDFCDVPIADRPDPFRLNAITYLDHHPTRVGALSRLIDQSVWDSLDHGQGLSGVIKVAADQLEMTASIVPLYFNPPKNIVELNQYLAGAQHELDLAYAPIRENLDSISHGLSELLNTEHNWEDAVDTTHDPEQQLRVRGTTEKRLAWLLASADKVHLDHLATAGEMLAALADTNWTHTFATAITKHLHGDISHASGVDGDVLLEWDSPVGRCVIGGAGPNRYHGKFAFIFDIGGDDVYDLPPCHSGHLRVTVDLAGDDDYRGAVSSGAAIGCVDVLIDCAGNDSYRGTEWSQGAGCLGVGILADYGGDDIYTSHWCSQGAAFLGIGLLYDHAGSDHYMADVYAQGFAYTKGFGMLLDRSGNDSYRAGWKYPDDRWPNRAHLAMSQGFGYGMRPWSTGVGTSGGIGLLSDKQGDDVYDAGIFSQGGSYWYSLGILHDWQGADRYSAGQYSQGSGIHLSFAALLDDSGDDSYDAYAWLEQGNAHDWSSGCLEDYQGNDTYRSSGASQGCGFFVSFAYLLDSHGDDRYYIKQSDTTNSQGGGNMIPPRHAGSLGMLIDLGHGDDWYSDPRIRPGEAVVKSERGIAFDDGIPEKK
jgi:hypothetical protein